MAIEKITSYSELQKLADKVESIVKECTTFNSLNFVRYGCGNRIYIDVENNVEMYGLYFDDIMPIYDKVRPILLENPLNMFCWVTARGWKKGGLNPDAIEATPILRIMFDL